MHCQVSDRSNKLAAECMHSNTYKINLVPLGSLS